MQAVLDQLGLGKLGQRHPHALSGGQQQRVAIGRALVYSPPVILLDEPLSNLDAKLREEARAFLRELIIRLGLSALMVTHDQSEAMAISDRILLLNNGKIEQQGTPQEMYGSPSTLFTAEFMGSNNRLDGKVTEVRDGQARIEGRGWSPGARPALAGRGPDGTAVIRVEQVRLADDPDGNHLDMPLLTSMYLGDRWEYLFRTPDADPAHTLALRAYGPEGREPGPCRLALPASKVWVFPGRRLIQPQGAGMACYRACRRAQRTWTRSTMRSCNAPTLPLYAGAVTLWWLGTCPTLPAHRHRDIAVGARRRPGAALARPRPRARRSPA